MVLLLPERMSDLQSGYELLYFFVTKKHAQSPSEKGDCGQLRAFLEPPCPKPYSPPAPSPFFSLQRSLHPGAPNTPSLEELSEDKGAAAQQTRYLQLAHNVPGQKPPRTGRKSPRDPPPPTATPACHRAHSLRSKLFLVL